MKKEKKTELKGVLKVLGVVVLLMMICVSSAMGYATISYNDFTWSVGDVTFNNTGFYIGSTVAIKSGSVDLPDDSIDYQELNSSEMNVANKLLKLDTNAKTPFVQSLALSRATQPVNSKGNTFSTVQATINDMDTAGWVYVPPGTYTEAVDITGKNNLMLFGAGWNTTKITYGGNDHTLDIDNSDDVIIRDLRIDQTSTGNGVSAIGLDDAQRCKIQDIYIGDADEYGVFFKSANSAYCEIVGCFITGTTSTGIKDDGNFCSNLKIVNNNIKSCGGGGISIESPHVIIANNIIESCGWDGGIYVLSTAYAQITDNQIIKSAEHGIILSNVFHSIVNGNKCFSNSWGNSNTFDGIYVYSSDYTTIVGNNCYDDHSGCTSSGCQRHGIYVHRSKYHTINGNVCGDNLADGIKVHGISGHLADYNTFTGNVCEGNGGRGIYIFGDKGSGNDYANKNIVVGNQLYNNTGTNLDDDGTLTESGHNIV